MSGPISQPLATPLATVPGIRKLARLAAAPALLYVFAAGVYGWAAAQVTFAANEGSAYYVAVARNLVNGRGLVTDALWSYATPPLVVPRPAFELWQPLASFVAAAPMTVLGPTLGAAQLGMALVGGLLAPLAWLVARDAATAIGADTRRTAILAAGSGAVVALAGPLVLAVSLPDSTIPFAVAGVVCAWLVARSFAATPGERAGRWFVLGLALGVCWLARHEALWLAATAVALGVAMRTLNARALGAAVLGGMVVSGPWMLRNLMAFGTPLPGQALHNALLTSNEQVFAYAEQPSLGSFLAQGPDVLIGNVLAGAWHNAINVLLVPAAPLFLAGALGGAVLLWRQPSLRRSTLGVLLLTGLAIYGVTSTLFPVASLWGTFEHAAGPLVVGLAVAAVVGLDRAVQAVGRRRRWQHSNAWLAPLALAALSLPLTLLLLAGLSAEARAQADRYDRLATALRSMPALIEDGVPIVTDHPVWLSDAIGRPAIALPAEPPASVGELAALMGARLLVVIDERGPYPAAIRSPAGAACFAEQAVAGLPSGSVVASVREECR
jgi:hypothetical protein